MIDVLVPVLGRPQNVEPLIDSFLSVRIEPSTLWFIASDDDNDEILQIRAYSTEGIGLLIFPGPAGHADFAKKINHAYQETDRGWPHRADWIFQAADDVEFTPGWDTEAVAVGADPEVMVVGTNDAANPRVKSGRHATHSLIRRGYVETQGASADGPGTVFSEAYGHQWCNPPEAPIWMGDLSFKAIGDVKAGDEVIGWSRQQGETFSLNRLGKAVITNVASRRSEIVRVVTESGRELRCTPDHNWLNALYSPSGAKRAIPEWVTPRIGRTLSHVIDQPTPVGNERLAGWLAGIYDGEGTGIYVAMQSADVNPAVVARIEEALQELGVAYTRGTRPPQSGRFGGEVEEFILNGGRQGYLDFLLRVQPVKTDGLIGAILGTKVGTKVRQRIKGAGAARFGKRDRIIDVRPDGFGEVISLTTTTGNYIAWGYASKNCDNELVELAQSRGVWAFADRSVVRHRHPIWRTAEQDDTYRKGSATARADAILFKERSKMWRVTS